MKGAGGKLREEIENCCKTLGLRRIGGAYEEKAVTAGSYEEYLRDLLLIEVEEASNRGVQNRIRRAKFPCRKYLEDLETGCLPPTLRKKLPELSGLGFIEAGSNVIMTGNPGTGKTHTAIGLGIKACEAGYKVLFTTVPLLVTQLKECNSARTLQSFQNRFIKYDLVIVDELGYISFDREGSDLLFTVLSQRSLNKSVIVTSNLTFERWSEVFKDPAITNAMVDRLTFKAILIDMEGESYRLRETMRMNGMVPGVQNMPAEREEEAVG